MTDFERNRSQKLKIILFTLKILTILFTAVPVFQKIFPQQNASFPTNDYKGTLFAELFTGAVIGLIMLLWKMLDKGNSRSRIYTVLELTIFFLLIMFAIYCSGGPVSSYKFLFLYLIISHAIEYGITTGFVVSAISSVLVVLTDVFGLLNNVSGNYLENDVALIAMFISIAWTLGYYSSMEDHFIDMLKEHANRDGLTSSYNHRYFFEVFEQDFETSRKEGRPLCLAMLDIDHFKEYNDTYGHQRGDAVLVRVVEEMKKHFPETDGIFRYGGDEFSIILHNCSAKQASELTDAFRSHLEQTLCVDEKENPYHVKLTVSVGIAEISPSMNTYLDMISRADTALYNAKFLNRNRVEVFSSIFDEIDNSADLKLHNTLTSMRALISVINSRDDYTYNHTNRVAKYCWMMARQLNLGREDARTLMVGAFLHDLGKINYQKELLIASAPLSDEQWAELKKHPVYGAEIVRQIGGFDEVVTLILQHHERYDGKGYPYGVEGPKLNRLSRVLTVADSYDAMVNDRPYKKKMTQDQAIAELRRCSGTQFDPELAEEFIRMLKKI
ncbi:MAG: diguanylate cyclase [Firmicutes bacterium]|nr:diguanylate cyclase [Bacillota bacterium]